ncbi:epoxide hydrolase [Ceratobasidium sp. AG-Ba]|nr:epoxide hydrolase [Ceratobasidium sp. AG-Ba]
MKPFALVSCLALPAVLVSGFEVKPFKVELGSRIPHMNELIKNTILPSSSVLGSAGKGIGLDWLKDRQSEWTEVYDWDKEEDKLNQFNHSLVDIGDQTVHFIHQRSSNPNSIPVLLIHGWPGSFYEFNQVIMPLTSSENDASFHVVVPSLPGFGFSSPAPLGWNLNHTAALFDTLMHEVLGYESYIAVGGDWGCVAIWALQNDHSEHIQAVQFAGPAESLTDEEKQRIRDNEIWGRDSIGYFIEMTTRPATIGLGLYDNPIGQLAWMGEKYLEYSDPQYGVPPSTITNNTILTAVSIYYLTRTFETAANIYFQNPAGFQQQLLKAVNDIPMGFSEYPYEGMFYPKFYLAEMGNLVYHSAHKRGGHFSALDNPPAYVDDIRRLAGLLHKREGEAAESTTDRKEYHVEL